jgi:hypothetical protein
MDGDFEDDKNIFLMINFYFQRLKDFSDDFVHPKSLSGISLFPESHLIGLCKSYKMKIGPVKECKQCRQVGVDLVSGKSV